MSVKGFKTEREALGPVPRELIPMKILVNVMFSLHLIDKLTIIFGYVFIFCCIYLFNQLFIYNLLINLFNGFYEYWY